MAKGIPESGTISLSDLKAAFRKGSVIQTNTYSTAANGSITAPAAATWVKIEAYGAGGGGCGYGGTEQGGGGGGYSSYECPVTGSVTSFGYRVGAGGAGGTSGNIGLNGNYSWANGIPTVGTMYAYAGYGGDSTGDSGEFGGIEVDFRPAGTGGTSPKKRGGGDDGEAGGTGSYFYGGAAGGPSGGARQTSNGADGNAPGGGGAGNYSFLGAGGDGADGKVIFTWYNIGSTQSLRDFISGGSICDRTVTGNNKNIPVSGTISLKDFYSADELGYNANTGAPTSGGSNPYAATDWDSVDIGNTADARANLSISTSTGTTKHGYNMGKAFDKALDTNFDTELLSRFQMQFTKTVGTTPTGSAVNTWITCNFGPRWYINVSRSAQGTTSAGANGFLRFRRVDNNQEVVNVAVYIYASATVLADADQK